VIALAVHTFKFLDVVAFTFGLLGDDCSILGDAAGSISSHVVIALETFQKLGEVPFFPASFFPCYLVSYCPG